jgi:heme oxygenase (biliverdin-IX-beta and delta-forming)
MLVRLELETRAHAEAADLDRMYLLEQTTPTRYRRYLAAAFGFEAPIDTMMACMTELDPAIAATYGLASKLRRDLRVLGITDSRIDLLPRCPMVPLFESTPQLLGWIYVLERSRMLNGLIRRQLPPELAQASAYLSTHDGKIGTRYRRLGQLLDAYARELALSGGQIVRAAHDAFRAHRHWFAETTTGQQLAAS